MKQLLGIVLTFFSVLFVLAADPPQVVSNEICLSTEGTLGKVQISTGFFPTTSTDNPAYRWYSDAAKVNFLSNDTSIVVGISYFLTETDTDGESEATEVVFTAETAVPSGFTYEKYTFCKATDNRGFRPDFVEPGDTRNDTWTSSNDNLDIIESTGEIRVQNSQPGTYTVTRTAGRPGRDCQSSTSVEITIIDSDGTVDSSFTYPTDRYCFGGNNGVITPTITGASGGIFTISTMGSGTIAIDSQTGAIDIDAADVGSYTVRYTVNTACGTSSSSTQRVTIDSNTQAMVSYPDDTFCQSEGKITPTITISDGDTRSFVFRFEPAGLRLNAGTGEFDAEISPPGDYLVTFEVTGTCGYTLEFPITILDNTPINLGYNSAYLCTSNTEAIKPIDLNTGTEVTGTFTYTNGSGNATGLQFDSGTGYIVPSESTAGTYTIMYTGSEACGEMYSTTIDISEDTLPESQVFSICATTTGVGRQVGFVTNQLAVGDTEAGNKALFATETSTVPLTETQELATGTYYYGYNCPTCACQAADRVPMEVYIADNTEPVVLQSSTDNAPYTDLPLAGASVSITQGQGLALQVRINNPYAEVVWTGPNNFSSNGQQVDISQSAMPVQSGVYTATINYNNDCQNSVDQISVQVTIQATTAIVKVSPKVILQGAALGTVPQNMLMRDDLRQLDLLPLTSPYTDGLSVPASVFEATGSTAVVDWVYVELRRFENGEYTVVSGQSGLLQADGAVISVNGLPELEFAVPEGGYHISINHRNHLAIISDTMVSLSGTTTQLDFTDGSISVLGGESAQTRFNVAGNRLAMWTGDSNGDETVRLIGSGTDVSSLRAVVYSDPTNTGQFINHRTQGYFATDYNMDGETVLTGSFPDIIVLRNNVFANPENTDQLISFPIQSFITN